MGNKDRITALAREHGEYVANSLDYDKCSDPELRHILAVKGHSASAQSVLEWLSTRFFLVEKSKMIEEYKSAKHDNKIARQERLPAMLAVASARKALLESLFPEIAKEVE